MKNLSKTPEKKFQTRSGVIKHKRVTKELRKSKKQWQDKRKAGLKGARVTWQSHGSATGNANGSDNDSAMAKIREEKRREVKERQGKKSEEKLRQDKRRKSKEKEIDISNSDSNEQFSSSSTSLRTRASTGEPITETPDDREKADYCASFALAPIKRCSVGAQSEAVCSSLAYKFRAFEKKSLPVRLCRVEYLLRVVGTGCRVCRWFFICTRGNWCN
jgi:hypothetical protein